MKFNLVISPEKEEEITAVVHSRSELTDRIERLAREYSGDTKINIFSEEDGSYRSLDYGEIECITVESGKTVVIASDGRRYTCKRRLYEFENSLPSCFIRINKSAIANGNMIKEYRASFSGGVNAVFRSGYADYVSRRCFAAIRKENGK